MILFFGLGLNFHLVDPNKHITSSLWITAMSLRSVTNKELFPLAVSKQASLKSFFSIPKPQVQNDATKKQTIDIPVTTNSNTINNSKIFSDDFIFWSWTQFSSCRPK
jgi:hypothetical protein